ncbi:hypothetical protein OEZ86_005984 [Tetradesmus obliquus]|nr:hypothetical protein OEZ86_005984 [Tetradesmus obliquus]
MTTNLMQLLAGQPSGPKAVVDGPRGTASFSQPRGLCKEEASGQLLVVDGVGGTAVLRTVVTSGRDAGYVATVLGRPGNPPGSADGSGSSAALSSGSWAVVCLPGGSALLVDFSERSFRHICPPGWQGQCGVLVPAGPSPPPSPPPAPPGPTDSCPKPVSKWWRAAWLAAGYALCLATLAGYKAAGSYVAGRIARLRQQHMGPARPSYTDGGGGAGSYQVLPPHTTPAHTKKRWLSRLRARAHQQQLLDSTQAAAEPRAARPQLAAAAAAAAAAEAPPSTNCDSQSWRLQAAGAAAAGPQAPAVTGDTARSGTAAGYSTASAAGGSMSNASTRSGTAGPAGYGPNHLQTVVYEPLATGDSSLDQAGQSNGQRFGQILTGTATSSSEHGTSAAWEAGGSLRASGRGSLSAAPDAAAAAAIVHQRPTGQSLGGFSDVESLL